jgi:hypothetical protein
VRPKKARQSRATGQKAAASSPSKPVPGVSADTARIKRKRKKLEAAKETKNHAISRRSQESGASKRALRQARKKAKGAGKRHAA